MLQAKSTQGALVTLALLSRNEIEHVRRQEQFFCPGCHEEVIVRAGPKTIPHFAHRKDSDCPGSEGGEGSYHEAGKLLLYEWFRNQHIQVSLEEYIDEIKQRPDLLLRIKDKRIAIEYQCATVSIANIQKRNRGYKRANIIPVWILGANHFERLSNNHIRMNQFTLQFLHQFSPALPTTLFFLCPHTKTLATIKDIYMTSTSRALSKIKMKELNFWRFRDLFEKEQHIKNDLYTLWKKEKYRFRLQERKISFGSELTWRKWLYEKGFHFEQLPSIIHLPISSQFVMKTPHWNWQSRIFLGLIHPLKINEKCSIGKAKRIVNRWHHTVNYYPLINQIESPIMQYFLLLMKLGVLEKQTDDLFIKRKHVNFYHNVEDALKGDYALLQQLMYNRKQK